MAIKKLIAEAVGTALLVFFAVGVATENFGFLNLKPASPGFAAGVVTTALAFGLVLMGLAYALGPVSGCHVNPAVTMGFLVSGRIKPVDAAGYWVAQFVGGIAGALALWGVVSGVPGYSRSGTGLGTNGYAAKSALHLSMGAAFTAEVRGGPVSAG